ncbi:hypothetical protein BVG16_20290 [Paenibacillus selenitireducens]|uniref:Uncharacterized protein n=1 Tax=Paenibacillus selenitireducens TaxID=1324314 RepID=A0A1T2X722_9BACL|nr:hypothetical protein [Paenibacillus selenitireducens]OPA75674.1 hypothetical protein BVG16_20290 [Paenibacillus selenitireducens]
MKLKKMFSILLISAGLMTVSLSAFADGAVTNSEVTPQVSGLGDTRATALDIFPGSDYNLFLETATDEDWFKWTNNTGAPKLVYSRAYNKGSENVIVLGAILQYTPTIESTMIYANPTEKNNSNRPSTFDLLYIPAGTTVFFKVQAKEFVKLESYRYQFLVQDIN